MLAKIGALLTATLVCLVLSAFTHGEQAAFKDRASIIRAEISDALHVVSHVTEENRENATLSLERHSKEIKKHLREISAGAYVESNALDPLTHLNGVVADLANYLKLADSPLTLEGVKLETMLALTDLDERLRLLYIESQSDLYSNYDKKAFSLRFGQGQTLFTKGGRDQIEKFIHNYFASYDQSRPTNTKVTVFSWADVELPGDKESQLSEQAVEMAEKRGEHVVEYIKAISSLTQIEQINMAEKPTFLQRLGQTEAYRLKVSYKNHLFDDNRIDSLAFLMSKRGGPGHALIVLEPSD